MPTKFPRTQVLLYEEEKYYLSALAQKARQSESAVIRELLRFYAQKANIPPFATQEPKNEPAQNSA